MATPSTVPPTAMHKVFYTTELLELILVEVALDAIWESSYTTRLEPMQTLSQLNLISPLFATTIASSQTIKAIIHGPYSSEDRDDFTHISHGMRWLFRWLDIDILYWTHTDEGTTEVRILHEIRTGRYVDEAGVEVVEEHLRALDGFLDKYGADPKASWRGMRLLRGDDGNVLTFDRLEFIGISAPRDLKDKFQRRPKGSVAVYEADWRFGPEATLGMFVDVYEEVMKRSAEEHGEFSRDGGEVEVRRILTD